MVFCQENGKEWMGIEYRNEVSHMSARDGDNEGERDDIYIMLFYVYIV